MTKLISGLFYIGPLLFAYGFLWPLTTQITALFEVPLPFGLTPLWAGFIVASVWGSYAQIKGSWL